MPAGSEPTPAVGATRPGPPDDRGVVVVVPWLEGGGGQSALAALLRDLDEPVTLVRLFTGSRNDEPVTRLCSEVVELGAPRTPVGAVRAARALAPVLAARPRRTYSLMRASHVVLGMLPRRVLRATRLAATFHQLPSQDSGSWSGRAEDLLVRRALRHADLVTAPSQRAVEEVVEMRLAPADRVQEEANRLAPRVGPVAPPRGGRLDEVRLLAAGRLTPQKGLDRVPALLGETTVDVHLRVAGDGPERAPLAAALTGATQRLTADLVGHRSSVEPDLDWADAVLMPSRWELNPMLVWEAWAAGRPVLAADLPVFHDLARQGPLVVADDATAMAVQLRRLADDAAYREELATAGRAAAHTAATRPSALLDFMRGA